MTSVISEPVILAVINVVIGGIALKVVEYLINKNKAKLDEIAAFRKELSDENRYLREQWRQCEEQLNTCRSELADTRGRLAQYIRTRRKKDDMSEGGTNT